MRPSDSSSIVFLIIVSCLTICVSTVSGQPPAPLEIAETQIHEFEPLKGGLPLMAAVLGIYALKHYWKDQK